jgi:hypothetical protein
LMGSRIAAPAAWGRWTSHNSKTKATYSSVHAVIKNRTNIIQDDITCICSFPPTC